MRYHKLSLPSCERSSRELTPQQREDSLQYPIAVVNLLRKGSMDRDRSEARLYSAFCDLLTALHKQSGMSIANIGFDWHELASTHAGLQPVVQMLWAASENNFRSYGFTQGYLCSTGTEAAGMSDVEDFEGGMRAVFQHRQQGIFRFNCADSLDRTNVASFYSSLQVRHLPPCCMLQAYTSRQNSKLFQLYLQFISYKGGPNVLTTARNSRIMSPSRFQSLGNSAAICATPSRMKSANICS